MMNNDSISQPVSLLKYPNNYFNGRGFFSMLSSVILVFKQANNREIYVDLSNNCHEYLLKDKKDPHYTGNVWSQYFVNPKLTSKMENMEIFNCADPNFNSCELDLSYIVKYRKIYKQYVKLIPSLQSEFDALKSKLLSEPTKTLGVHIRGLDKSTETTLHPPEYWENFIKNSLVERNLKHILLCTDDLKYFNYFYKLKDKYNIVFTDAYKTDKINNYESRFTPPINEYVRGKEAIFDCYLLSQCDTLLKNRSNLSAFSSVVDDKIQHIINIPGDYLI